MTKQAKQVQITERDLDVLELLLRAKVMTGKQIVQAHFNGSKFGYARLSRLRDSGYIESEPNIKHIKSKKSRRKISNIYYLARRGIDLLAAEKGQPGIQGIQPAKLLPRRHEYDFHLALNGIRGDLILSGKLSPDEWEFGSEAKKRLGLLPFVPLYGVARDLHIFRAREPFRPRTAFTILDVASRLPRSVVLYTEKSARDILLEKHLSGQVNLVHEGDMAELIPLLITDPLHYLKSLVKTIKKADSRVNPVLTGRHYAETEVTEGAVLFAETVTGCIPTLTRIKSFEGDFYFVMVKDKDDIHGLPLENRAMNVCLPDGSLYRVSTHDSRLFVREIRLK